VQYKYQDTNFWCNVVQYENQDTNLWCKIMQYKYQDTNLWCKVVRCPAESCCSAVTKDVLFAHPEVGQLGVPVLVQQNIVRLQIPAQRTTASKFESVDLWGMSAGIYTQSEKSETVDL